MALPPGVPDNPAKFSREILSAIEPLVDKERAFLGCEPTILDPFGGVGLVHTLGSKTMAVEIEPEWAAAHPRTKVGDSRRLAKIFPRRRFWMVITSPTYGTRMSDHHNAQERCKACGGKGKIQSDYPAPRRGWEPCEKCEGKGFRVYVRNTYKHKLGRDLTPGNSGEMQWGDSYREFHAAVWLQVPEVMEPGGLFVLNISNHIRKGIEIDVAGWHKETILANGCWTLEEEISVQTRRNRHGANREARPAHEWIYAFRFVG